MPVVETRIEPWNGSFTMDYADHKPLLAFARRAAALLVPQFSPPDHVVSVDGIEHVGDTVHGFTIRYEQITHPHWSYVAGVVMEISAYGLPEGYVLSLSAVINAIDPSMSSITLRMNGPQEFLVAVGEAFDREFN